MEHLNKNLEDEAAEYGDIVQGTFLDAYLQEFDTQEDHVAHDTNHIVLLIVTTFYRQP